MSRFDNYALKFELGGIGSRPDWWVQVMKNIRKEITEKGQDITTVTMVNKILREHGAYYDNHNMEIPWKASVYFKDEASFAMFILRWS